MSRDARVTVASLFVAAVVSLWAVRDSARLLDIPSALALAVMYIVFSSVAAAVVYVLLRRGEAYCLRHVFFSCVGPAALMPGTAILLSRHSIWGVAPVAAIAWIVRTGLGTHSIRPEAPRPVTSGLVISPPLPPAWDSRLRMALVAGLLVELTGALVTAHEVFLSAVAAALGSIAIASVPGVLAFTPRSHRCLDWRGMERKWLLVFANALTLTCFALFPHIVGRRMANLDLPQSAAPEEYRERATAPIPPDDDIHQGIIIYPEEEQHAVLVPPIPVMHAMAGGQMADPLSIPFYGVYWVYRPPWNKPPPKSLVMRANPAKRNLHSNDGRTLNMEARQNFGTYFDPKCCTAISVVAFSNDPQPNSIGVDLFVRDSADNKAAPSFVGSERLSEQGEQKLHYVFPPALRRFDEVILKYQLQPWRRDRAPKVSIQRFVFEPR